MPLVLILHAPSASLHVYICCTLHTFLVSPATQAYAPAHAFPPRRNTPAQDAAIVLAVAPSTPPAGPPAGCLLEHLILSLLSIRRPTLACAGCGQQCVVALHCRKQAWLPSLTCC